MIIRRSNNELKPPSIVGVVQQNGDSHSHKSAIKKSAEKSVNFKKDETKEKEKSEKLLMISYEKVKRHKQRLV